MNVRPIQLRNRARMSPWLIVVLVIVVAIAILGAADLMTWSRRLDAEQVEEKRKKEESRVHWHRTVNELTANTDANLWFKAEHRRDARVEAHRKKDRHFTKDEPLPDDCAPCKGLGLTRENRRMEGVDVLKTVPCPACNGSGIRPAK